MFAQIGEASARASAKWRLSSPGDLAAASPRRNRAIGINGNAPYRRANAEPLLAAEPRRRRGEAIGGLPKAAPGITIAN